MNKGALRARWRSAVGDTKHPYLWTEADFDEYLDDAQNEAARRSHLLVDSTSSLTLAAVVAGDKVIELDPRILFVRRARLVAQKRRLTPTSVLDLDERVPEWEAAAPGVPQVFAPDWQTGALVLWPPSIVEDTLALTVVREPLSGICGDNDSPEIAPRYHLGLLNWVSFRAYSKEDCDGADPKAAEKALKLFESEFGEKSRAIDEQFAREHYFDVGDFQ